MGSYVNLNNNFIKLNTIHLKKEILLKWQTIILGFIPKEKLEWMDGWMDRWYWKIYLKRDGLIYLQKTKEKKRKKSLIVKVTGQKNLPSNHSSQITLCVSFVRKKKVNPKLIPFIWIYQSSEKVNRKRSSKRKKYILFLR